MPPRTIGWSSATTTRISLRPRSPRRSALGARPSGSDGQRHGDGEASAAGQRCRPAVPNRRRGRAGRRMPASPKPSLARAVPPCALAAPPGPTPSSLITRMIAFSPRLICTDAAVARACLRTFASPSCAQRSSTTSSSARSGAVAAPSAPAPSAARSFSTTTPVSRWNRSARRPRASARVDSTRTGAMAATSPRASVSASRAIYSISSTSAVARTRCSDALGVARGIRRPLEIAVCALRHHDEAGEALRDRVVDLAGEACPLAVDAGLAVSRRRAHPARPCSSSSSRPRSAPDFSMRVIQRPSARLKPTRERRRRRCRSAGRPRRSRGCSPTATGTIATKFATTAWRVSQEMTQSVREHDDLHEGEGRVQADADGERGEQHAGVEQPGQRSAPSSVRRPHEK